MSLERGLYLGIPDVESGSGAEADVGCLWTLEEMDEAAVARCLPVEIDGEKTCYSAKVTAERVYLSINVLPLLGQRMSDLFVLPSNARS